MRALILVSVLLLFAVAAPAAAAKPLVDTVCDQIGGCTYPQMPCQATVQVFCGGGGGTCLLWIDTPSRDYCL